MYASELPLALGADADEWLPELRLPHSVWEIFGSGDDAACDALALAFAQEHCPDGNEDRKWLWVQDAPSIRFSGRPFLHGVPPALRSGLIHVEAGSAANALWAMEEGVRCGALSFVLGEIAGNPRALDFTATRRLVLAAERHGVALYLLRREGFANLSAARLRWQVAAAPSALHRWNAIAPGAPRARAELFRGRGVKPGTFVLGHGVGSHEPDHRLAVVSDIRDRPLEPDRREAG
ncbi:ImuA family protein [Qipengyuania huizhouensis]|uniref:ImuA family protein n=1 Tax=Qipengyuania huizhouensis TaxID=2867245 RepID=UPI001C87A008|nr:hypothetical protein [Qipengyuania huizhouensis]MBX7459709.1 hypothetical protein [Qipengyuania huizhouensis]